MKIIKQLGVGSYGKGFLVEAKNGDKYVVKIPTPSKVLN